MLACCAAGAGWWQVGKDKYLIYVTKGKFNIHILTIQYKNALDYSFLS
jgi:hypothetical protein